MKKIFLVVLLACLFSCDDLTTAPKRSYFDPERNYHELRGLELGTVFTGDSNTYAINNLPGWNMAYAGYVIDDIIAQVPLLKKLHPIVLVVMIGSNDAFSGEDDDTFQIKYTEMVKELKLCCNVPVCISILPTILQGEYAGFQFSNARVERWNGIIETICESESVVFFNNYSLFKNRPDLFMSDGGVHLNRSGQNLFVKSLALIGLL